MKIKSYSELLEFNTLLDRYRYLKLDGELGAATFGFDRYLNQQFYKLKEWKIVRAKVIVRDLGCDLGIEGLEIVGPVIIHHMNPISIDDVKNKNPILLDPEYLISTQLNTHNAIHYGDESLLILENSKNRHTPKDRR